MKHWKNGPLENWKEQPKAQFITFQTSGARRVKFEVMSVGKCEVWATQDGGQSEKMVAVGCDAKLYVETVIHQDTDFLVKTEKSCKAYVNIPDLDQNVEPKYADENFVNLEPRIAQNPDIVRLQNMYKSTVAMMQQQIAEANAKAKSAAKTEVVEDVVEVTQEEEATNDTEGDSAAS